MFSLVGINDDYGDGILTRDAVLVSTASLGFSGALAQGGIRPSLVDSRRPVLLLRKHKNQLQVVPGDIERSTLDALLPVIKRVAQLMALPRGWNSYDASPVSDSALRRTVEFLVEYVAVGFDLPVVVPTVHGGLQLEWHCNGVDIEVEVASDGHVAYFAEDDTMGEPVAVNLAGNEDRIKYWLTRTSR